MTLLNVHRLGNLIKTVIYQEVLLDARYTAFVRGLAPNAKHILLSADICHPQVSI
jgi:hypothetical protein